MLDLIQVSAGVFVNQMVNGLTGAVPRFHGSFPKEISLSFVTKQITGLSGVDSTKRSQVTC